MGTSDISGIGKVFAQSQTQKVKGNSQEEELQVAFGEVMSQMQACVSDELLPQKQAVDSRADTELTTSRVETDYERYGKCDVKVGNSSDEMNSPDQGRVTEKMDKFAEDVKEVLKEELGISEEQLEEAMTTLGLQFSDLLSPNRLAALIAELTGAEDMSALLCSEKFMTIMNAVGELGKNLLEELGVSDEQLVQMLDATQDILEDDGNEVVPLETGSAQTACAEETESVSETAGRDADIQEAVALGETVEKSETEKGKLFVNDKTTETETKEETETMPENHTEPEKTAWNDSGKNSTFSGQNPSENSGTQLRNDMSGVAEQNFTETTFVQTQDGMTGSQVDVSNIIKQIVEYSRVTLSNTATTMEMQLAPENLGKIYLALTSKNGVVSAHITAQNEAVKEALESQLVEFKQNMNQAGIKVDAVEVAVGSHEFEKNLEQNAKQDQQQAEEQEKAVKQTRHINLNDLDELTGMMTEEESLVAQMMADQGNSVDFTA